MHHFGACGIGVAVPASDEHHGAIWAQWVTTQLQRRLARLYTEASGWFGPLNSARSRGNPGPILCCAIGNRQVNGRFGKSPLEHDSFIFQLFHFFETNFFKGQLSIHTNKVGFISSLALASSTLFHLTLYRRMKNERQYSLSFWHLPLPL